MLDRREEKKERKKETNKNDKDPLRYDTIRI